MKMLRVVAGALALALSIGAAAAQTNPGYSPLSVVKGGTGATTASGARANLGLAIGSAVQAWDADLDALAALSGTSTIYYRSASNTWSAVTIGGLLSFAAGTLNVGDAELTALAGLTSAADKCAYFTGSGTAALTDCPTFGRSLMNTASASAARTALSLVPGSDVQVQDADLQALAALSTAADKVPYFTGASTAALADFPSTVRTWFTTPSSANLRGILSDETGTGAAVFGTAPTVDGLFDISGALKFSTQSAPAQITSNQNDYNPSSVVCASTTTLLINSDAARDITGLAGGVAGCVMRIVNNGAFTITLKEASASSTAANRFSTGGDIELAASAGETFLYDGVALRWRKTSSASAGGGSGTVTSIICNGVTITTSGTCPPTFGLVNHSLAASASGSALTIALKDAAGSDPSASSPVNGYFRNVTGATGSWTQLSVTGALSLTVSSGSTLGVTSSTAFRLWVVLFNDGGTARLGVINCSTATQIHPLVEGIPRSSTAEGGAGAADSAGVIYTGTAVTSKSFLIVGYIEWSASGLTAGTWTTTNLNFIQTFGPGVHKPGAVVQVVYFTTTSNTTTTSASPGAATALTTSITPTSAVNLIRASMWSVESCNTVSQACAGQFGRNSSSNLFGGTFDVFQSVGAGTQVSTIGAFGIDKPNTTSSTTYTVYHWSTGGATASNTPPGASLQSAMTLEEIQG